MKIYKITSWNRARECLGARYSLDVSDVDVYAENNGDDEVERVLALEISEITKESFDIIVKESSPDNGNLLRNLWVMEIAMQKEKSYNNLVSTIKSKLYGD